MDALGKDDLYTNGYEITTTLDWVLQKKAEEEIVEGLKEIDKRQGYKGPLAHLSSEEMAEFLLKQRRKFFEDESNYFIFLSDGSVSREYEFDDAEFINLAESEKQELEKVKPQFRKFFEPGILGEEESYSFIKHKKQY